MRTAVAVVAALALSSVCSAQSLTTTFAGGNGQDGAMFDLTNIGTNPIQINSWDFRLFSGGGGTQPIEVYYVLGGYGPNASNPAAWTLLGTQTVTTAVAPAPTNVTIGGLTINPGQTYGIYFTTTTGNPAIAYTNGANSYSNADLRLDAGVGRSYPFGSTFTPRTWNGTVYYSVIPAPASLALLGIGGLIAGRRRR